MARNRQSLLAALIALVGAGAVAAQPPYLLRDLRTEGSGDGGSSYPLVVGTVGDRLLFTAETPSTGREIFSYLPGGSEPPSLLIDAAPGVESGLVRYLGRAGSRSVFVAEGSPRATWITDGSPGGTEVLFSASQQPVPDTDRLLAEECRELGDRLLFLDASSNSIELWSTDGTEAGTSLLATTEYSWPFTPPCARVGNEAWFILYRDLPFRRELWSTSGSPASTHLLTELPAGPESTLFALGTRVAYFSYPGRELWVSDGTSGGTLQLTSSTAPDPMPLGEVVTAELGRVAFRFDDGVHGEELWVSDGTPGGTLRLTDFATSGLATQIRPRITDGGFVVFYAYSIFPEIEVWTVSVTGGPAIALDGLCPHFDCGLSRMWLARAGGKVVFPAEGDAGGAQLYATDGTAAGTERLGDLPEDFASSIERPVEVAGLAIFPERTDADGEELWITDGTDSGTHATTTFEHYSALSWGEFGDQFRVTQALGRFWVSAFEPETGAELWSTTGSPASTELAGDVARDLPGSDPVSPSFAAGRFVFLASNGTAWDAWRSDGTEVGTTPIGLPPGQPPSGELDRATAAVDGRIFVSWIDEGPFEQELFAIDAGTGAFTQLTVDPAHEVESPPFRFRDEAAFFTRIDGRLRLWLSGGTPATTRQVFLFPEGTHWADFADYLDGRLYFVVHDNDGGDVWRTDGTSTGTFSLEADRYPGVTLIDDPEFFGAGGFVFFRGDSNSPAGLLRTDGTVDSTVVFLDTGIGTPGVEYVLPFRGQVYFISRTDSPEPQGPTLMRTAPDLAAPEIVKTFDPEISSAHQIVATGTRLFLSLWRDDGGRELWVSDGTEAGTVKLDWMPPYRYPEPSNLTIVGDRIYFTATDDVHGIELWASDGTADGTEMVADVAPGGISSRPGKLFFADCRLFFVADDAATGLEPWMIDFDVCPGLVFVDGFESGDTSAWSGTFVAGSPVD